MVTGAHLQVLNQMMLLTSQIVVQKAKIQNGTPNCIKIPLFLTFESTHSWSTPHKTIPNKSPGFVIAPEIYSINGNNIDGKLLHLD
jgi:hypothetical protein